MALLAARCGRARGAIATPPGRALDSATREEAYMDAKLWTDMFHLGVPVAGKVRFDRLKAELITLPELESAAHKQGFASLDEVDRAVLEPGGTVSFIGRKPTPEAVRHEELTRRLDQIVSELAALRLGLARPS